MQNNSVIVPENRNQFNSFSCFSSLIQIYMSVLTERAVYGAGAGWEWEALKSLTVKLNATLQATLQLTDETINAVDCITGVKRIPRVDMNLL